MIDQELTTRIEALERLLSRRAQVRPRVAKMASKELGTLRGLAEFRGIAVSTAADKTDADTPTVDAEAALDKVIPATATRAKSRRTPRTPPTRHAVKRGAPAPFSGALTRPTTAYGLLAQAHAIKSLAEAGVPVPTDVSRAALEDIQLTPARSSPPRQAQGFGDQWKRGVMGSGPWKVRGRIQDRRGRAQRRPEARLT